MLRKIFIISAALLLVACASTTPNYQQASSEGAPGYYENQITENRYRVTFTSRSSNQDIAKDFALLRAAELTMQKGYDWFQVADRDTNVTQRNSSGAGGHVGVSHQTATVTNCGLLSCSSTTRPVGAAHVHADTSPGRDRVTASVEFVMGKGELPDGATYYSAQDVADTIRQQRM
jgi:hypothetical protein